MKSLLLVLVKSQSLGFSGLDMMATQEEIATKDFFLVFWHFLQREGEGK
jgi:hypothetical protein